MSDKSLIIVGAGDSTIEILDIINDINKIKKEKIKVKGILDDNKSIQKKRVNNVRVIGLIKDYYKFKNNYFFLSILSYKNRFKREKIIKDLLRIKSKLINIVHPSAIIGNKCRLGKGCLIYNNANIYSETEIGDFSTVSQNVSVAPKAKIERNCFLSHGVIISAGSLIKKNSYIGYKSSVIEDINLSEGCRVMPYSMVNKNIDKKNSIVFGTPAKIIGFENNFKR